MALSKYEILSRHLAGLARSYGEVNTAGGRVAFTLARTHTATLPAAAGVQMFTEALTKNEVEQKKSLTSLVKHLNALQDEERKFREFKRKGPQQEKVRLDEINAQLKASQRAEREVKKIQRWMDDLEDELKQIDAKSIMARTDLDTGRMDQIEKEIRELDIHLNHAVREEQDSKRNLSRLQRAHDEATTAFKQSRSLQRRAMEEHQQQFQELAKQQLSAGEILKNTGAILKDAVTVTGFALAVKQSYAFNQTLIAANSALGQRQKLWSGVLAAQEKTGDSLENLTDLTAMLRRQAQLHNGSWQETLVTASKVSMAIGASVDEVEDMVRAARAMRVAFGEMADSVTNTVNSTSLSVRETLQLVNEIKRASLGFNVRLAPKQLEQSLRSLTALEEALRRRGATEGAAQRILSPFTSMQQKGGLGLMFGTGGPDFATNPQRVKEFTRNISQFLEPFRNAPLIFERMASSFGLSTEDAQALIDASHEVGKVESELARSRVDLNKRLEQQMASSGKVWMQFKNNLVGLLMEGLTPVTKAVDLLNTALGWLRNTLVEVKQLLPDWIKSVGQFVLVAGGIGLVGRAALMAVTRLRMLGGILSMLTTGSATRAAAGAAPGLMGSLLAQIKGALTPTRPRVRGIPGVTPTAVPTGFLASLRGFFSSAAARAGRALPTFAAAGQSLLPKIGVAAAWLRGLLPFMISALPVLLGAAVVGAALGGIAVWIAKKQEDRLRAEAKALLPSGSTPDVRRSLAMRAEDISNQRRGVDVARQLRAVMDDDRRFVRENVKEFMKEDGKGGFRFDPKVFDEKIAVIQERITDEYARLGKETTVEKRNEIYEGIRELTKVLSETQAESKKIIEELKRELQTARQQQSQQDVKNQKENRARAAAMRLAPL